MKSIEIDDDLYRFLLSKVERFGETPSQTLNRLLRFPGHGELPNERSASSKRTHEQNRRTSRHRDVSTDLAKYLKSSEFRCKSQVVERFLAILSFARKGNPEKFAVVTPEVRGRTRKYFASTADELKDAGTSVNPKRIPDSEYWVVTNNDTGHKRDVVRRILRALGYGSDEIELACSALIPREDDSIL
jgi:negative modulator of initiation of replication